MKFHKMEQDALEDESGWDGKAVVGMRVDIPQDQNGRGQSRGRRILRAEHCVQRFSGKWSRVNSKCCKIKQRQGQEAKEVMSAHLMSPGRPYLRNLDLI